MRPWTLGRLITWGGSARVLVLVLVVGGYASWRVLQATERELQERAKGVARTLAAQVLDPVLTENQLTLVEILRQATKTEPDVRYAFVASSRGRVLAHTFEDGFPVALLEAAVPRLSSPAVPGAEADPPPAQPSPNSVRFDSSEGPLLDVAVPLFEGQLGWLHVGFSRRQVVAEGRRVTVVLVGAFAVALGLMLWMARAIGRRVGAPLAELGRVASRVPSGGVLPEDFHVEGTAEVRELAQAFATMVADLRQLEAEREATARKMSSTERLAAVGELAAGLAHEVINPLDGVIECVRHLSADPEQSERAKRFLPLARDGLTRIERVMRQMLAFARTPGPAAVEPCQVGELVRGVAGLVQGRLAKRGVELSWAVAGDCSCLCDRQSVEQALLNLILNASDAIEGRPGAKMRLGGQCDDRWVRLTVEDNGPGVPGELREKIFEPFFTTKEPGRGTGLGLTVSRQNLRHCGGDIVLDGSPLGGACFVMLLPRATDQTGACDREQCPGPTGAAQADRQKGEER